MLCLICQQALSGPEERWSVIEGGTYSCVVDQHEFAEKLASSAQSGCHLCSLANAALRELRGVNTLSGQDAIHFRFWRDQSEDFFTGDRRTEIRLDVHCGDLDNGPHGTLQVSFGSCKWSFRKQHHCFVLTYQRFW